MKIKHVYGNVLKLDIPLTIKIRTMEGDVPTEREEPFYPDVSKGCVVILGNSYNRKIQYDATVSGNVAHIEDDGIISIGTYKVTVKCHDEYGNPYRYMVRDIVEICDATIDAGIEAGVEFNAETYTLDGAVFVSYGVEQVQSDWNEQDDESKAYIKNKPDLTQYATKNELREVESEIPTLPDHIVTDEHYVHTDNNYTTEEKTKLAGLQNYDDTNVLNLIEQTNQNFANYYTKQQTYSQSEVNHLLETQRQGQYVMVEELPTASVDTMFKIYLVPSSDPQTSNVKDEYITIDNGSEATTRYTWEKIGSTAVDLSGYSTTEEMNAAIASALASYYTKTETDALLGGKQDTLVSGTNIKTINNQNILGEGNITIQGGGSSVQSDWNQTDTEADDYIKNKPTIPDVPSWALAPTKPTYTADEVGAIPNAELFYGSSRQTQLNYVNLFCDALWSAAKRWNVSVSVVNSSGETVSPMIYSPDGLFNINYEDQSLRIESGTTAKILIKGGDDIDDNSSRMFTYGTGYIYVHFYSKTEYLPNSISGRVYTHYNNIGWTNITFSAMTDYQDLPNVYKAAVQGIAYPSALEITVEAGNSQYTSICEIEWWTIRQNMGDVPVFSKARAETLYQPLTLKNKLTVNDKVEANRFVVPSSNNNYVLLGGGGTKALTEFFSGNYNDLTNKPTIPTVPTNVSAFTNDAGYLTQHQDISGKADKSEMSVVDGTGTDADKTTITLKNGTSATVLKSHQDISGKQDALVSGTNIKTINNESVLGSGNINIDISGKEDKTAIEAPVNQTDSTLPITTLATEVGKYYRIDVAVDTLAVTLPAMTDLTTVRTVVIYLTVGTTPAVTISAADSKDVYYQDGFEIEAGKTYEINALFNGSAWIVASVEINTSNS